MRFSPGKAAGVLCEAGRVFFTEAFRGPAAVFAEAPCAAPAAASFSVHLPVKSSKMVREARCPRVCPPDGICTQTAPLFTGIRLKQAIGWAESPDSDKYLTPDYRTQADGRYVRVSWQRALASSCRR